MTWVETAFAVGLEVGLDQKGLTHIHNELMVGQANCGALVTPGEFSEKVCMHCRELPGREAHYLEVTRVEPN